MTLAELFGSKSFEPTYCWQDREIRFDSRPPDTECRKGEELIDTLVRAGGGGGTEAGRQVTHAFPPQYVGGLRMPCVACVG